MSRRHVKGLALAVLSGAMMLSGLLGSQVAQAATPTPVSVVNGDFASPVVQGNSYGGQANFWTNGSDDPTSLNSASGTTRGGGEVYSAQASQHPQGLQSVDLSGTSPTPLSQRLQGVQAGATVTVTWDDSPNTWSSCAPNPAANVYTISGSGGSTTTFTTNATTSTKNADGNYIANWTQGRTYTFTASQDMPRITFLAKVASGACGALITNVQATQIPAPSSAMCDGNTSGACSTVGSQQAAINKCQPDSTVIPPAQQSCLASVAGDPTGVNTGQSTTQTGYNTAVNTQHSQDINPATQTLCRIPNGALNNTNNGTTNSVPPSSYVFPPNAVWFNCTNTTP